MPVYTLNPSHRRGARKASRPTSLRERIAARRNPEPKHLVLMPHRDYVAFRTSDGRTGSEPNMGPGKSGPTMALLLNRLGVLTENGMSPNWTVEVIKQEPSVLDTYLEGRPANRRRNPLSEDGAVVSNPRRRTGMYSVEAIHDGTAWAITDATATDVKVGFAMSYDEARRLVERHAAEARAKGHRLMWYDMSTHNETKKRNPLSEDGAVVSNPRAKVVKAKKPVAKKRGSKRSGGRTVAQSNAAKAMKLFHSGRASSLGEAWEMVRGGR